MNNKIYQLINRNGLVVEFITLGGRLTSVKIPENNSFVDVLMGYDTVEECAKGDAYMGAICGRFANRISNGRFALDGKWVQLAQNNGSNHLHGGNDGFHKKQWEVIEISLKDYTCAYQLSILSANGDENYPGNLKAEVIYALNDDNELLIDFKAVSDKKTIINLTIHPYFNLKGVGGGDVLDHMLEINANYFTPIDQNSIPTGELKAVSGTAMDFTTPTVLSERINCNDQQVKLIGGLDHNWVLNKKGKELALAARVKEPVSGRSVEVFTTQPGLQVYTAMHFDGTSIGKGGHPIMPCSCIALEAQNFPDAPNNAHFPSVVLEVGEVYREKVVYRFSIK